MEMLIIHFALVSNPLFLVHHDFLSSMMWHRSDLQLLYHFISIVDRVIDLCSFIILISNFGRNINLHEMVAIVCLSLCNMFMTRESRVVTRPSISYRATSKMYL